MHAQQAKVEPQQESKESTTENGAILLLSFCIYLD